ncbi:MAG: serine protease [Kofleriaceae bacterium]
MLAIVAVFGAAWLHRRLVRAPTQPLSAHGLTLAYATTWLPPEPMPEPAPRLLHGDAPRRPATAELPYRVQLTSSVDSTARLEILVDELPPWSNLVTSLELDRRTRWGELYATVGSEVRSIAGHDWLRTSFRYAHAQAKGDEPRLATGVEYATVDREHLYVITLHGSARALAAIERVTASSLRVASRSGMPLLPHTRLLGRQARPPAVTQAFRGAVMVVVADLDDHGRLRARGGGSGAVVGSDGSILTSFHVIHDRDGRLHELFVVGRYRGGDRPPELVCAGRPDRAKLERDLDLALIKCDLDLDGRAWTPAADGPWPSLRGGGGGEPQPGSRVWVLGYPDVGGGGLTLSQGLVEGYTAEDGGLGRDYLKTDASITHGNSGGPVVDDDGRLVGIATAFRVRVDVRGDALEVSRPGLVRPLAAAARLLAWAQASWVPCAGCSDASFEPTDVEAAAEGVHISTNILNAGNDAPIEGASLMVLRPGVVASEVDLNRLGEAVIASGRSGADGQVHLRQMVPVPGTYGVIVIAPGFRPLVGDSALVLAADTPPFFDPWGQIRIEAE